MIFNNHYIIFRALSQYDYGATINSMIDSSKEVTIGIVNHPDGKKIESIE